MNESATVECPWCQQDLTIPPEAFGQRVSCQFCSGKFVADAPARPDWEKSGALPGGPPQGDGAENVPSHEVPIVALLITGFILLLIAAGLGYWSVYRPWDAMHRQVPNVSCPMMQLFFAVFLGVFAAGICGWGLLKLLLRKKFAARGRSLTMDPDKGGKVAMWLTGVVAVVLSFKLDSWFDGQIEGLGYEKVGRVATISPPPTFPTPKPH